MASAHLRVVRCGVLLIPLLLFVKPTASAEGIPEPGLVLYGTIRNLAQSNARVTDGKLTWQFLKVSTGRTVAASTGVTNILDQFSYVLEVPCETIISGAVSSNALDVARLAALFDRSQVAVDGNPATFVIPAQTNLLVSSTNRGRIERVDLLISSSCPDADGNGLCDWWELKYFGYIGVDPRGDADGDGMSNLAEYMAGTDPADRNSAFRFETFQAMPAGGMKLQWQSAEGHHYSLLRYSNLLSTSPTVIQSNIPATAPLNTLIDTNGPPGSVFFYRLLLQP
jgi:hypothetical protein